MSVLGRKTLLTAAFVAASMVPATATPIYFSGAGMNAPDLGSLPVSFSGILDGNWNGLDAYDITGVLSGSESLGPTTAAFTGVVDYLGADNKLFGTQWGPLLTDSAGVSLSTAGLGFINTFSNPSLSTAIWQAFAIFGAEDNDSSSDFFLTSFDAHAIGGPVEVPEPLTMATFAFGLAGVAAVRRRKTTKNVASAA